MIIPILCNRFNHPHEINHSCVITLYIIYKLDKYLQLNHHETMRSRNPQKYDHPHPVAQHTKNRTMRHARHSSL
jgi:hypothetical protein